LHASGPTLAAVLALGVELGVGEEDFLKAFVCGFEVGATFGSRRLGVRLNESGWHSTAVLGRLGVAGAAAYLLALGPDGVADALGLAATQAGGLTASFGTMAKPFHAGKAAADGLMAAQLAEAGLAASRTVLDAGKGLFGTLFQDREAVAFLGDLGRSWQILENSFKPYAACQLAHAPIDAALLLRDQLGEAFVTSITVAVNPLAVEIAGVRDARTPTEGRFSTGYCIALALKGHPITPADFVPERLADRDLAELSARVSLTPDAGVERNAARLEATLSDGRIIRTEVRHAFGSVGNPMSWPQLEGKFSALVAPVLGSSETDAFLRDLANFERPGSLQKCLVHIAAATMPVGAGAGGRQARRTAASA
jgi:2-methylcitrate dehydratase PrpD